MTTTDRLLTDAASLAGVLRARADAHPERVAFRFLEDGETETAALTYGELHRRACDVATRLQRTTPAGERALFMYPPSLDFVVAFFGCLMAKVIPVPVYPPRQDRSFDRLAAVVRDAAATRLMTTQAVHDQIAAGFDRLPGRDALQWVVSDAVPAGEGEGLAEPAVSRDDLAFLQYTSGSTGDPKGVVVTHGNLLVNLGMIHELLGCPEEAAVVSWLPQFHDMGLIGMTLYPLAFGGTSVQMPPAAFLQKPVRWLQGLSRYGGMLTTAPNFAYELCTHKVKDAELAALDLRAWTLALNGAEPIRHDSLVRFSARFAAAGFAPSALVPCYGMAEATLIISGKPVGRRFTAQPLSRAALEQHRAVVVDGADPDGVMAVSSGRTIGAERVLVVDPEKGHALPDLSVGEIWVSGAHVAAGYWNRPEATRESFEAECGLTPGLRYLRTGDLGFFDGGELYVTGRLKDLVIVGGRNLYPQDVEQTVERAAPAVRKGSVAAFALEGDHGETLALVAELERGSLEGDHAPTVDAILREVAATHEVGVGAVVLIPPGAIPKTSSGKIQRRAARRALEAGRLEVVHRWSPPRAAAEAVQAPEAQDEASRWHEALKAWFRDTGEVAAAIDIDRPMAVYGVDSVTAVEFTAHVEGLIGEHVPDDFLWEYQTIREMTQFLLRKGAAAPR